MEYVVMFLYLFVIGSLIGWVIELFYRRFFSTKRWINPGFLNGPFLPLYGFGLSIMYFICLLALSWWMKAIIIAVLMTFIELIAGIIFINIMKIKLWDYSNERFNYKGIISLKYSIFWGILGIVFVFMVDPVFHVIINHLIGVTWLIFPLGLLYGLILSDFGNSINLAFRIRQTAIKAKELILYEYLKKYIAKQEKEKQGKRSFFFAFRSSDSVSRNTEKYIDYVKKQLQDSTNEKIQEKLHEIE